MNESIDIARAYRLKVIKHSMAESSSTELKKQASNKAELQNSTNNMSKSKQLLSSVISKKNEIKSQKSLERNIRFINMKNRYWSHLSKNQYLDTVIEVDE